MIFITSKTHRYISVRVHPSDYILKKFHRNEIKAIRQFHTYYGIYHTFYKELVEFITGNTYDDYYTRKYMFDTMDVTKEIIHELTGVKICRADNVEIFCIPKTTEGDKIFDYMVENIPCKFKILKKTRGTYMDGGAETLYRDMNDKSRQKFKL